MNRRRLIETLTSLLLVSVLIYFADLGRTVQTLSKVKLEYYGLGVLLFLSTYLASGRRWQIIAESTGHEMNLLDAIRVVAVSYSFNKLLPWNFGDMVRSKISESYHNVESHGNILGGAGFERVLDAASISFIIGVAAVFTTTGSQVTGTVAAFAAVFIIGAMLVYSGKLDGVIDHFPDRFSGFLEETLGGFRAVSLTELLEVLTLSQIKWWTEAIIFYVLALSISSGLGFWDAAIVTSIMSVFSALPISPAGIGPGDAAATGLLVYTGIPYSTALSLVVLQRTIGVMVQGVIGAIIYGFDL
ncbi:lysylphosphatidylglycerol synthase transmembrane domain-containing protein [Candidatus Nanohalococcus occultus]|uniref:Glycosyl transferase family 2 n=1 Tax=Candidatus Nanohalococcus occultus TaxID=2978047 RepID=A0ABY8CFQ3_9ARCH|nr:Glycosyl transferase family 2 [Candidatus Nanohaloarchaeota archaeon SVXNc]